MTVDATTSDGSNSPAIQTMKHTEVDCSADCKAIILHPDAAAAAAKLNGDQKASTKQQHRQQQQQHYWGQALYYLDHTATVVPGDTLLLAVQRQGPKLAVQLLGGSTATVVPDDKLAVQLQGLKLPVQLQEGSTTQLAATSQHTHSSCGSADRKTPTNTFATSSSRVADSSSSNSSSSSRSSSSGVTLQPAARPPWLRAGAGIEDPAVWSVTKCRQLLGQMLQRAPGGKFPPIWNDLALMQVRCTCLTLIPYQCTKLCALNIAICCTLVVLLKCKDLLLMLHGARVVCAACPWQLTAVPWMLQPFTQLA
jgi:hypothetical protein